MQTCFGNNVHVQAVTQVNGVDVVAFEVRVHDGEEDLEEEVDRIEEDCEEEEPISHMHQCRVRDCGGKASSYHASPDIMMAVGRPAWGHALGEWNFCHNQDGRTCL